MGEIKIEYDKESGIMKGRVSGLDINEMVILCIRILMGSAKSVGIKDGTLKEMVGITIDQLSKEDAE